MNFRPLCHEYYFYNFSFVMIKWWLRLKTKKKSPLHGKRKGHPLKFAIWIAHLVKLLYQLLVLAAMILQIFLATWPNQVLVADPVVVLFYAEIITAKEIAIGSRMLQTPFKLAPIVVNVNPNVCNQDQKDAIMLVSDPVIRILVIHVGK